LHPRKVHGFLFVGSEVMRIVRPVHHRFIIAVAAAFLLQGCFVDYWLYSASGGDSEAALGEQHDVGYPAADAFLMTQDALRGKGVLFEVKPDNRVVTLWRDADTSGGLWGSLIGVKPRYRYEIEVVPTGPRQSRIVVNVRTEDIADNELDGYKVSKRLDLFGSIDQLAQKYPPASVTPREGGVNFALLPGEDLKALAKRATGNEDNWRQIAEDNGLKSPSDLTGVNSVWIRNPLLDQKKGASATGN
jgi:hypothetical protein